MARTACFSRRHFHRLTLQLMGETPGAHQRRLRLDRGAWLLLTSRATVLEIALETGWKSHETFTRAFRAQFGATPSALRKNRGGTLPRSIRLAFGIARLHGTPARQAATAAVALPRSGNVIDSQPPGRSPATRAGLTIHPRGSRHRVVGLRH